jgi:hypothetical protein
VTGRDDLARRAVVEALRLRGRNGRAPDQPICPVDLALEEGVDVRFEQVASLEGMYAPDGPLIVLGSLRPPGRRAYTCAHELGHHAFGHGLRIDQLLEGAQRGAGKNEAEYVADRFAAALLMPKLAVLGAFAARGWNIANCSPEQAFTIAGALGVGYTTLLGYLERTLGVIDPSAALHLRTDSPKSIRSRILGEETEGALLIVDEFWRGRPVDCEVGDGLIVPAGAQCSGSAIVRENERLFRATRPGKVQLTRGPWTIEVRVSRAGYAGLAAYRHLEEADDEA